MQEPEFIVSASERTRGGSLNTSRILQIRVGLLRRGFVLLPSDTCYSVAALAFDKRVHDNVNIVLNRERSPISLAFSNFAKVKDWIDLDPVTAILLERFTPGPITVVCKANLNVPIDFTTHTIGSKGRTIGVRIPDSVVEREIAGCTRYLITTVAVRNPKTGRIVQDFGQALDIVGKGMHRLGNTDWVAVEGGEFYASHSTVVQITEDRLKLLRQGDIPFDEIQAVSKTLPNWSLENWS